MTKEIIELYLIETGFVNRTPHRQLVTRLAHKNFGLDKSLKRPDEPELFE